MPSPTPQPVLPRRVVVTGVSVACALGFEVEDFWRGLIEGRCGISRMPNIPEDSPLPVRIAGRIPDALLAAALPKYQTDDPDRASQLALYVVGRALDDAGLPTDGKTELDFDIILGTGHGNVEVTNLAAHTYLSEGYRKLRPTTVIRAMFNRPANIASIRYQLTGASHVVSAACATGSIAFGEAFHHVRFGLAEGAIAACADSGLDMMSFAAWNRLGVLSRIPEPERASRPFDAKRGGLVIGEGAAAFMLESLDAARRRGARIHAEVLAHASSSDARHIVQPDSAGQAKSIHKALAAAGLAPTDIDYVNAHGVGTDLADVVESATLRDVFGAHADNMPVSNTKAQLGHLMGATAGVELVTSLLVLKHGLIPPCRNLDEPDPRCPLNFVRGEPLRGNFKHVLKNSFAFGGTNSTTVLKRWEE